MTRHGTPWPLRFLLLAAAWGSTFLFIKIGDEALSPLQIPLGRLLVGTATLLAILGVRRERIPAAGPVWDQLAIAGILLNVAPFTLFAYGERHVSSVLAGIWNATVPLFTLPIAILSALFTHAPHAVAAKHVLSVLALGVFGTAPALV